MDLSRRSFLQQGARLAGGAVFGPLVVELSGCGRDARPSEDRAAESEPIAADEVLLGLYSSAGAPTAEQAVRLASSELDWSWLGRGDSVLVKIACNSGNPHPAVTAPAAVRGLCAEMFARGAGRVVVADQAGVASVRLAEGERRFSSTRALVERNGLYAAIVESGAEPHFFDDHGYETGYFAATVPFPGSHWSRPLMLPRIVQQVDHIVYLPRLSSHAICGYTHGHKLAMGWLRDDSRHHVHHDAASIYEKYVEINYTAEIRDRFRLVLTAVEALLLDLGPDEGTVAEADPRIVVASRNLPNHDALATAILLHLDAVVPGRPGAVYDPDTADAFNQVLVTDLVTSQTGIPWGASDANADTYTRIEPHGFEQGIASDRALSRAYALDGGVPTSIRVRHRGAPLEPGLEAALRRYSGGVLRLA